MAQITETAGIANIDIVQGDTFSKLLTWTTDGTTAINLTGYTFETKVMLNGAVAVAITTTNTDLTNGKVTISLTNTQTATLITSNKYDWYFRWTVGGVVKTVLQGAFNVGAL